MASDLRSQNYPSSYSLNFSYNWISAEENILKILPINFLIIAKINSTKLSINYMYLIFFNIKWLLESFLLKWVPMLILFHYKKLNTWNRFSLIFTRNTFAMKYTVLYFITLLFKAYRLNDQEKEIWFKYDYAKTFIIHKYPNNQLIWLP